MRGGPVLLRLMFTKRFWPLFWTQFLGAFNDNFFKNALVILITYQAVYVAGIPPEQMVAFAAAVFMSPYLLVSGTAGELADKLDKASLIRWTKLAEIGVMGLGAAGFLLGSAPMLLGVLFFMGLQSAVFDPCKYGILPEHLREEELVAGNALVGMSTYLAILLGTLAGGLLIGVENGGTYMAIGVLGVAGLGVLASRFIEPAPSANPELAVNWDPVRPTTDLFRLAVAHRPVWLGILGIVWFWTIAGLFLSLYPTYSRDVLHGDETLATMIIALFSVGIGLGSSLCDWLSRGRVELGLVPIGALGMTVFLFDLWVVGDPYGGNPPAELVSAFEFFFGTMTGVRVAVDLIGLAAFSGFLVVPLYSFIQIRAQPDQRARVIAGTNVLIALSITVASLALMGVLWLGCSPMDVLVAMAMMNVAVAIYMYTLVREYLLRFAAWILSFVVYRLRVDGEENVPREGGCMIVCNHVSFIDWFVIMAAVRRPIRFVMYHRFMKIPVLSFLFRQARVIPIAGGREKPKVLSRAFDRIHQELNDGWLVCIFPEGDITEDGELGPFKGGIDKILSRDEVPVVPMAISGLWGSFFSRKHGNPMTKPFRRVWSRVWLTIGEPIPGEEASAERLREVVRELATRHPAK